MKVSLRWLRDYAPLDAPLDHLVRTLNETGTEVGTAEDVAAGIIAARITRLEPVPKSSHGLMLADLDVGPIPPPVLVDLGFPTDPVRVVTGAANLHRIQIDRQKYLPFFFFYYFSFLIVLLLT